MREIRTSGFMSGEGKRIAQAAPRLSSTLLIRLVHDFTRLPEPTRLREIAETTAEDKTIDTSSGEFPQPVRCRATNGLVRSHQGSVLSLRDNGDDILDRSTHNPPHGIARKSGPTPCASSLADRKKWNPFA